MGDFQKSRLLSSGARKRGRPGRDKHSDRESTVCLGLTDCTGGHAPAIKRTVPLSLADQSLIPQPIAPTGRGPLKKASRSSVGGGDCRRILACCVAPPNGPAHRAVHPVDQAT